jgi:hypothetical protein
MPVRKRNRIESDKFILDHLESDADFSCTADFDCGKDDLNEFFKEDALEHKKHLFAETYYFVSKQATGEGLFIPVAFVCFLNDNIVLTKEEKKEAKSAFWKYLQKHVPNHMRFYESYPAVKIGRLGVKKKYKREHIGTHLMNMIKELFITHNRTGCRFITVDADQDEPAKQYYIKNGFDYLTKEDEGEERRIMFFDLKTYDANPKLIIATDHEPTLSPIIGK